MSISGSIQSTAQAAQQGLAKVSDGRNYLDTLANKYIVKPKDAHGIGGFVFDYEGDTRLQQQADITDHWAEDNNAIQDHIAIKPVRITLRGFVGELSQLAPQGVNGALSLLNNKLETVEAYLGHYTPGMVQKMQKALTKAQSVVNKFDNDIARAKNIVGMFTGSSAAPTKQELAYEKLNSLYINKTLISVETPFKFFDNMAIETIEARQDEETKSISEITITVKQMRFASVEYVQYDSSKFKGRLGQQKQPEADKGKTKGKDISIAKDLATRGWSSVTNFFGSAFNQ